MRILGISAFYHDSAAVLLHDGEIIAAAQEERFTRKKHDARFPHEAVDYCLRQGGVTLDAVDFIAFYDKPFLKFERLLETYMAFAPRGFRSFAMAMPLWIREKLFQKDLLANELKRYGTAGVADRLLFAEHHLSHAASAFYPSPFEDAAVLTMDGPPPRPQWEKEAAWRLRAKSISRTRWDCCIRASPTTPGSG
jgi:carbamoyltransferase